MRRQRATVFAIMLAAAVPLIAGCADTEPFTKETFVMGTKAWITIAGMSDREAEQAADAAFREMYRIESVMSTWRSTSEISHLNTESNGIPRAVTLELYSLIDSSLYYSQRTFGAFDITVRPLVVLWGLQGGPPRLPSDEEISRALDLVGSAKVTLHSPDSTVTLAAGMQLDLAGVAKGYAVDRCVAVLKKRGVKNAIVNIGGNIFAFGKSPGAQGWNIGIRDPRGGMETVGSLLLSNEAVATSGNYENYVEIKGKRYGHILDPRTGKPVSDVLSVTVVAPTGLESDALSTGLFVLGPERAQQAIASLGHVRALFALPRGAEVAYTQVGDFRGALTLTEKQASPDAH